MEGINGFDTARDFGVEFFFFEEVFNFFFNFFESLCGLFVVFFDKVFEIFKTFWVDVGKGDVGELDTETTHVEAVGERGKNFQGFSGDFLLFVGRESGESASVMEAVSELDDENADVVAGGNHETKEIIFCFGEISVEVVHVFANLAEFSNAINEKSNGFAEFFFNVI